jgi:CheY-like chemotaxis protein
MGKSILILENDPLDLRLASRVANAVGIEQVHGFSSLEQALMFLTEVVNGDRSAPDVIVADLDLGHDSGFELLRFWRTSPPLEKIALIAWSALGAEHYKQMCEVFAVTHFVGKWQGENALRDCLADCICVSSQLAQGS